MTFNDKYNPNNPNNNKNLYPHASFETYATALCGIGISPPIIAGIPFNGEQYPNSIRRIPGGYFPYCANGNCIQNFNSNYVGAHTGEYIRCQR